VIAVYYSPEALTAAQYEQIGERLTASGAPEGGRKHHSCFGEEGRLMVYEIWDSPEDLEAFTQHLNPILSELGVTSNRPPDVMPVINLSQS
jgi:hypothetical protein